MHRFISRVIGILLVALATHALAQTQQELDWCNRQDGTASELTIRGCTAVIRSGKNAGNALPLAYKNRAYAYAVKGQSDLAIQDLNQAIRLNPSDAKSFNLRGICFSDKGLYERAIQDYEQAIRLDSSFSWPLNNRANVYRKLGQLDRAIDDYNRAIRLDANYARALSNLGQTYLIKKEYGRAITNFDAALKISPKDEFSRYGRGIAKVAIGDLTGNADIAAAKAIRPDVAEQFAK